ANLLAASDLLEQAALDPYEFVKDAYLQKRRNEVYDGNPPPDPEWDEDFGIDDLDLNETEIDSNE
ncbi:MAG: VacJ family lipoprotein, partial [Candidatus Brocadiaceae bacterium]|nr:VacJ family lipoprotein [Candidatus Brocadiaceae bacterium]